MKINRNIILGIGIYGTLLMVCLIGSLLCPMDPYHQITRLKNLPPSSSYLDVPDDLNTSKVEAIVSGLTFSVALIEDGTLVSWGEGITIDSQIDDAIELAAGDRHLVVLHQDHHVSLYCEDSMLSLPKLLEGEQVEHVYAYGDCIALLTNTKRLYVSSTTALPYEADYDPFQSHIIDLEMNAQHMALILDDGSMHLLGVKESILSDIDVLHDVEDVVLSEQIGLALHRDHTITLWGDGSIQDILSDAPIKELSASATAVFALGIDGTLYASGKDEFGSLQLPDHTLQHIFANTYQIYGIADDNVYAWGNSGFPLGSDAYGRDNLTRLFHGGLWTMSIALIAVLTETILGTLIGLLAGTVGGWLDHILMRIVEILSSIPFLPLMITLSAFFKDYLPQHERIIFVMSLYGILASPSLARIIRSQILTEREKEYVLSTKLLGAGTFHILKYELFPQIVHLLLVNLTLSYADSILLESSLSFLGFGVAPPYPTWGNLLEHAQSTFVLEHCWWQWLFPALCIFLCVWSIHLISEGLRKQLDPKDVKR